MKAAVLHELGQAPRYEDFREPEAGEGEAIVQVRAAGLHPIVKLIASGVHYSGTGDLPMVPGTDGVGTLEDGSRVFFGFSRKPWGAMAERTVVPRSYCMPLPDGIDDLQAAAIVNPGMSAWLSIKDRAALAAGETVLILGATGVAGHLAIQAARMLGAKRVVAAGRNVASLEGEPVDAVIGLAEEEGAVRDAFAAEAEKGIDVVIDYLWGRPAELLLDALAKGFKPSATSATRWVEVGESAGKTVTLRGDTLRSIDLTMKGSGFGSVPLGKIVEAIPALFKMSAAGELTVDVEPIPLKEVESGWTRTEKAKRIVFTT